MIDLHSSMLAYNKKHKTDFVGILDFCQFMYDKHKSVFRVGQELFYSHSTVYVYFKRLGVKMLPRGYKKPSPKFIALCALNTEFMTLAYIADMVHFSKSYIKAVLKKQHRTYLNTTERVRWNRRIIGNNMSNSELKKHGFLRSKPVKKGNYHVQKKT